MDMGKLSVIGPSVFDMHTEWHRGSCNYSSTPKLIGFTRDTVDDLNDCVSRCGNSSAAELKNNLTLGSACAIT